MITFIICVGILIASILLLSHSAFHWGFYASRTLHSTAMIGHHNRMIEILDRGEEPTFHEVQLSLDEMRTQCRRSPSFRTDFLGKDDA